MTNQNTLKLQNIALRAYHKHHGEDYKDLTVKNAESKLSRVGDTLELFLWREMGEAGGDAEEACRMLYTIQGEIEAVLDEMLATKSAHYAACVSGGKVSGNEK